MSNPTNDPTVKPIVIQTEAEEKSEEKLNFVAKTKQFVKTHKKATIAVAALGGLVGLAAVTGRSKNEPTPDLYFTPLSDDEVAMLVAAESENDTESA